MPARYEKIRDSLIRKGLSVKAAKTRAAKIENATRSKEGRPPAKFHRIRPFGRFRRDKNKNKNKKKRRRKAR